MKRDKLKKTIDNYYHNIEAPQGMEERISSMIDGIAAKEQQSEISYKENKTVGPLKKKKNIFYNRRNLLAAASIVIIAGILLLLAPRYAHNKNNIMIADTCNTIDEAYAETEKALEMIANAFNKGIDKVEKSTEKVAKSQQIIEEKLNIK